MNQNVRISLHGVKIPYLYDTNSLVRNRTHKRVCVTCRKCESIEWFTFSLRMRGFVFKCVHCKERYYIKLK